ncbi:MAG: iron complex outermembrane receptor protein, partial [Halieaceae bacterium]
MKISNAALHTLALSLATTALPTLAQQSADQAATLEEIIVTARKREESLMEIPMTVSAFSAQDIEQAGYTSVADLIEAVPGVTYGSYQAEGQGDSPSFRGVATNTGDPTQQNSSKFIDGVYVSGSLYTILFTDIERVEVIKGPQSALFGRATFSGAINYITKKPTEELSGTVSATVAEYGETRLNGTVSGPLIDGVLAGRVSAGLQKDGTPYDNVTNGKEMGDNDIATGSVSLLFTPTEDFAANLYMNYTDSDLGEAIRATVPLNQGELSIPGNDRIGGNVDQLNQAGIQSETTRINLTLDYDWNDYTLTSITGYGKEETINEADGDYQPEVTLPGLSFLCNAGDFIGPGCDIFQTIYQRDLETMFQEFRITSPDDAQLRWLAGVSYFEEEFSQDRIQNFDLPSNVKNSDNMSIFGSVSYDFTKQLTVTADARFQSETVELTDEVGLDESGDFDSFLPRVIVEYTPSDSMLVYASVSKGNKPGNFNAVGPPEFRFVEEEQLLSYELGTKLTSADKRYTMEAAVYFIDWTDQVFRFNDPDATVGSYFINAGETEIMGIDLSVVARLTSNLSATVAYSHIASEFIEFESQVAGQVLGDTDVSGNETPRTPANTAFASLRYDATLNAFGGSSWF